MRPQRQNPEEHQYLRANQKRNTQQRLKGVRTRNRDTMKARRIVSDK